MFTWLIYLLIGIAIWFIIVALMAIILNFMLGHILHKHSNEPKDKAAKNIIDDISKINIFLGLLIKVFHFKTQFHKKSSDGVIGLVKFARFYLLLLTIIMSIGAYGSIALSTSFQSLEDTMTFFVTNFVSLFNDDECVCYAKCTGDAEIDKKCTYELLFGDKEYARFIDALELNKADKEALEKLETGQEKGLFIIDKLTDASVECYQSIVSSNNKFRSKDKLDRSKMTKEELKADLIKLLEDYKVNGRHPSCEVCESANIERVKKECYGENHYIPGFTWDDIWIPDDEYPGDDEPGPTGPEGVNGTATGEYALQLDDGSFYWYHQSNEACNYNVNSKTYGRVSDLYAGGPPGSGGHVDELSGRGCCIYTLAICLSNLKGTPVTPYNVIVDLMHTAIQSSSPNYYFVSEGGTNGISYTTAPVSWNPTVMSQLINTAYNQYGIHAEVIEWNQTNVDNYLTSSDKIAYIMNSWGSDSGDDPAFSWYKLSGGHFMAVRKKDSQGYYCFTSCSSKPIAIGAHNKASKAMSSPISWSTMNAYAKHSSVLVIWRDVSSLESGGGSGGGSGSGNIPVNVDVYAKLASNPKFSGKAQALAAAYQLVMQTWNDQGLALGLMANVYHEGDAGKIEGIWHKSIAEGGVDLTCGHKTQGSSKCTCAHPYWSQVSCDVHNIACKVISNKSQISTLLSIPNGVEGVGIGSIQWSGSRRKGILLKYNSLGTLTKDTMIICDIQYMKEELQGDYSHVVSACLGRTPDQCASTICMKYEKPSDKEIKAVQRANTAIELQDILSGK